MTNSLPAGASPATGPTEKATTKLPKTVIIGLGNPLLGDDGVGALVAAELEKLLAGKETVTILTLAVGGLRLMEAMVGFERAIIIDAMRTTGAHPGRLHRLTLADLDLSLHTSSSHDTSLAWALESGRQAGLPLPADLTFWGIEAREVDTFTETLTPEVAAAVPVAVAAIVRQIAGGF